MNLVGKSGRILTEVVPGGKIVEKEMLNNRQQEVVEVVQAKLVRELFCFIENNYLLSKWKFYNIFFALN